MHMLLPVSQSALPPDAVHIWRTAVARERRLHIIGRQDLHRQLEPANTLVAEGMGSYWLTRSRQQYGYIPRIEKKARSVYNLADVGLCVCGRTSMCLHLPMFMYMKCISLCTCTETMCIHVRIYDSTNVRTCAYVFICMYLRIYVCASVAPLPQATRPKTSSAGHSPLLSSSTFMCPVAICMRTFMCMCCVCSVRV